MAAEIRTVARPVCFVCGAPGASAYSRLHDRHFDVPGEWGIRRCGSCGVLWLDPCPVAGDIARLYERYYTHEPHDGAGSSGADGPDGTGAAAERPSARRGLRNALLARTLGYDALPRSRGHDLVATVLARVGPLRRFAEQIPMTLGAPAGRLLDVGAGDGSFLCTMRDLGWSVVALEPDPAAAARARREHGFEVHTGSIEQHDLPPAGFDAITMSHVVEHVVDPVAALRAAGALLRPGGRLVVATPNADALGHARYGASWMPLDPPRHLHLFTATALREVALRAGLDVDRAFAAGRSAVFTTTLSRRIRRAGSAPGQRFEPGPVDRVAGLALGLLEETVRRDRGEELLLVAHRESRPVVSTA